MVSPKKAAAKKTTAGKAPTPKVKAKTTAVAKKTVTKKAAGNNKQAIKKGSKLACQVCGFAVTVDRICGCIEETALLCCKTPMKLKRPAAIKK